MTTKFAEFVAGSSWSGCVVSPAKLPVRVYVAAGSPGVMGQEATPMEFVVPVHVSAPFRVKVTGSPAMGRLVLPSVSTPDTLVASE